MKYWVFIDDKGDVWDAWKSDEIPTYTPSPQERFEHSERGHWEQVFFAQHVHLVLDEMQRKINCL